MRRVEITTKTIVDVPDSFQHMHNIGMAVPNLVDLVYDPNDKAEYKFYQDIQVIDFDVTGVVELPQHLRTKTNE